ncbi:MAG TPA: molybdopterin-dependent oxidoreductase [Chthonomonadaceae bacterium]|nr:molybdopterin-dependent oxidoreductase [Chthonomonadaceae bacterium]
MTTDSEVADEHVRLTRRRFVALASTTMAAAPGVAEAQLRVDPPAPPGPRLEYLTRPGDFGTVERGSPPPYQLPEPRLREIGMTRDTWRLEVVADGAKIDGPLTIARGNALDWAGLMKLAEKKSVRFLKAITCNNLNSPLGMGLWEGVPLREVVWLARPVSDVRRIVYYGHHNEDPKQMFRGSLSLSRVLEDPPGDYPVILAYKLNGEWLTGKRGGPVRMIVPEAYGFKNVKWLQRVLLTNLPGANDTYADEGNDIDSWMKSVARFLVAPREAKSASTLAVSGVAQVGVSGLKCVEVWLSRVGAPLPSDDPYFTRAPWQPATLLGPPAQWGGGLAGGRIPAGTLGFDAAGRPAVWPMRYAIAHWTAAVKAPAPGDYVLRCRAIDGNGVAQPMPRPIGHGGMNAIEASGVVIKR